MRNIAFVLFVILSACNEHKSYDLVIQNVGLFNGENDLGIVNIAINGDSIAAISTDHLYSDSVLDASGKYLIPGLVNSHVHIWESDQLKEAYKAGILANMGMHASNYERDSTMRQLSLNNGFSFYFTSGVAATVPGGHPTQITPGIETVNDSVSVVQFVNNRIKENVDYIKIIKESSPWFEQPVGPPSLPYDSIKKIIEYSHSKGLKAVVHIGSLEEMTRIAKFKPDGFVHMWYLANNSILTVDKLDLIKESGAFVVPTALVNERALLLSEKEGGQMAKWASENYLQMDSIKGAIKSVHEYGIILLAGTDNGNFDLNWGDDLIEELMLYHQSGLSNIEVLRTATANPANAWQIPVGFLDVGSKANMLLLNRNPIKDLEALRDISIIWKNGEAEIMNFPSGQAL